MGYDRKFGKRMKKDRMQFIADMAQTYRNSFRDGRFFDFQALASEVGVGLIQTDEVIVHRCFYADDKYFVIATTNSGFPTVRNVATAHEFGHTLFPESKDGEQRIFAPEIDANYFAYKFTGFSGLNVTYNSLLMEDCRRRRLGYPRLWREYKSGLDVAEVVPRLIKEFVSVEGLK